MFDSLGQDSSRLDRLTTWAIALHQARDFESLAEATTAAVRELVPCDAPLISLAPQMPGHPRLLASKEDAAWDQLSETALRHSPEDPVYSARLRLKLTRAASVGEFMSPAEFEKTNVFNEVWRPMGARHLLASLNPGRYGYRLAAMRTSGSDFDQAETMLLHAIARHMDAATARLVRDNGGLLPTRKGKIPIQSCSWLVCDRSGAILRFGEGAADQYRGCLGPTALMDRVPQAWVREFESRAAGRAGRPQRYAHGGRHITAYIAPIRGTPEEFSVFFVEPTAPRDHAQSLMGLGLTRREAEVLRWVSEGKTNPEIGIILGISELTAKKHVENLLHKLGVPTRTAAAARALEQLQNGA